MTRRYRAILTNDQDVEDRQKRLANAFVGLGIPAHVEENGNDVCVAVDGEPTEDNLSVVAAVVGVHHLQVEQ